MRDALARTELEIARRSRKTQLDQLKIEMRGIPLEPSSREHRLCIPDPLGSHLGANARTDVVAGVPEFRSSWITEGALASRCAEALRSAEAGK